MYMAEPQFFCSADDGRLSSFQFSAIMSKASERLHAGFCVCAFLFLWGVPRSGVAGSLGKCKFMRDCQAVLLTHCLKSSLCYSIF